VKAFKLRPATGGAQEVSEERIHLLVVDLKPEPGQHVALTPGFDLALVEEPDGLLVKFLLGTGVLASLEASVLIVVVAGRLLHHEIAANHQSRSPGKRLHVAARPWVTGVQHPGKNLVTRVRGEHIEKAGAA
jgi:hypothetical protein